MKIRCLLVAIGLATVVAACSTPPTSPDPLRPGTDAAAFDSVTTGSEGNRGGGTIGSGN